MSSYLKSVSIAVTTRPIVTIHRRYKTTIRNFLMGICRRITSPLDPPRGNTLPSNHFLVNPGVDPGIYAAGAEQESRTTSCGATTFWTRDFFFPLMMLYKYRTASSATGNNGCRTVVSAIGP